MPLKTFYSIFVSSCPPITFTCAQGVVEKGGRITPHAHSHYRHFPLSDSEDSCRWEDTAAQRPIPGHASQRCEGAPGPRPRWHRRGAWASTGCVRLHFTAKSSACHAVKHNAPCLNPMSDEAAPLTGTAATQTSMKRLEDVTVIQVLAIIPFHGPRVCFLRARRAP